MKAGCLVADSTEVAKQEARQIIMQCGVSVLALPVTFRNVIYSDARVCFTCMVEMKSDAERRLTRVQVQRHR